MRVTCNLPGGRELICDALPMGRDLLLAVHGGDAPHLGSVVTAVPRPSLTGSGIGVTSSVLNLPGHKDEAVARLFAERAAAELGCTALCACGIHIDGLDAEGIRAVMTAAGELLERTMERLSGTWPGAAHPLD